jgi:hypothetical protein
LSECGRLLLKTKENFLIVRYLILTALVLSLSVAAFAQKTPTFAGYRAKVEKVRNVKVNVASGQARMFRTNLRAAAKGGVNFAGHYILTGWGCGTNCAQMAVIDARTGRAYFPRELEGVGIGYCDLPAGDVATDAPAENDMLSGAFFKPNSRLLVFQGFKGGDLNKTHSKCGNNYWEWTGSSLRQVAFKPGKSTATP